MCFDFNFGICQVNGENGNNLCKSSNVIIRASIFCSVHIVELFFSSLFFFYFLYMQKQKQEIDGQIWFYGNHKYIWIAIDCRFVHKTAITIPSFFTRLFMLLKQLARDSIITEIYKRSINEEKKQHRLHCWSDFDKQSTVLYRNPSRIMQFYNCFCDPIAVNLLLHKKKINEIN